MARKPRTRSRPREKSVVAISQKHYFVPPCWNARWESRLVCNASAALSICSISEKRRCYKSDLWQLICRAQCMHWRRATTCFSAVDRTTAFASFNLAKRLGNSSPRYYFQPEREDSSNEACCYWTCSCDCKALHAWANFCGAVSQIVGTTGTDRFCMRNSWTSQCIWIVLLAGMSCSSVRSKNVDCQTKWHIACKLMLCLCCRQNWQLPIKGTKHPSPVFLSVELSFSLLIIRASSRSGSWQTYCHLTSVAHCTFCCKLRVSLSIGAPIFNFMEWPGRPCMRCYLQAVDAILVSVYLQQAK